MKHICVVLLAICGLSLAISREDPVVTTNVGQIRGLSEDGYFQFLGIPYGRVGTNIFGAAEPYPVFNDIFEANDNSNICIYVEQTLGTGYGTLDCLRMDIYVPDNVNPTDRLPVMVSIHGGAFIGNNMRSVRPLSLLTHDVIVVIINYRLGIYGFMCLDIPEVPGNSGLKDQVMAFKWIKENIEGFGGDPDRITIFGSSAGGMASDLHLYSSYDKYFNSAIVQSGVAMGYWMMVPSDRTIPFRIAEELGFNTTDIYEALSFMADVDPIVIAETSFALGITNSVGTNEPLTKPCVEQAFEGVGHFITEHPMNMQANKASTTPVMIGYNSLELGFTYGNVVPEFFDTYDFSHDFALGFDMTNDLTEAIEVVRHFYIGDDNISDDVRWKIADFGSDLMFNHPTQRSAQNLIESGGQSVYRYVFSYGGSNPNKPFVGAGHGEEIRFLFDSNQERTEEDQLIADKMMMLWTNFVKYGDPTPTTTDLLPVKWIPITNTTQPYMDIDLEMSLKYRPFHDRMAFWDLFYEEYGHYQMWYKP